MKKEEKKTKFEDWQLRLKAEREELLEKLEKLNAFVADPNSKMSSAEWNLLEDQARAMRGYVDVLTRRCEYYGLIKRADCGGIYYY